LDPFQELLQNDRLYFRGLNTRQIQDHWPHERHTFFSLMDRLGVEPSPALNQLPEGVRLGVRFAFRSINSAVILPYVIKVLMSLDPLTFRLFPLEFFYPYFLSSEPISLEDATAFRHIPTVYLFKPQASELLFWKPVLDLQWIANQSDDLDHLLPYLLKQAKEKILDDLIVFLKLHVPLA
jgi:hypothetical protein